MKLVSNVNETFHEKKESVYSNKEEILLKVVAGVPFEVPDDLGKARIQTSPNRYHEATSEDFEFAKKYADIRLEELKKLIATATFSPQAFLTDIDNHNEESLDKLDKEELALISDFLILNPKKGIAKKALIGLILERIAPLKVKVDNDVNSDTKSE